MKTKDGFEVSARSYYYLLDFNDKDNFETMFKHFGKEKLKDLDLKEYLLLFEVVTTVEVTNLGKLKL